MFLIVILLILNELLLIRNYSDIKIHLPVDIGQLVSLWLISVMYYTCYWWFRLEMMQNQDTKGFREKFPGTLVSSSSSSSFYSPFFFLFFFFLLFFGIFLPSRQTLLLIFLFSIFIYEIEKEDASFCLSVGRVSASHGFLLH